MPGENPIQWDDLPDELKAAELERRARDKERLREQFDKLMIEMYDEAAQARFNGGLVPYCNECERHGPTLAVCHNSMCPHRTIGS